MLATVLEWLTDFLTGAIMESRKATRYWCPRHRSKRAQCATSWSGSRWCACFHSFQPLSENNVSALIRKSAKKSCPLDPMPTSLVVGCLDVLLPVISQIINLSLSCRHFSEKWKEALVTPILKKPGLDPTLLNNLCPLSNLDFISKLTECCFWPNSQSYESIRPLSNLTIRLPKGSQHRNSATEGTKWHSHEYEL